MNSSYRATTNIFYFYIVKTNNMKVASRRDSLYSKKKMSINFFKLDHKILDYILQILLCIIYLLNARTV